MALHHIGIVNQSQYLEQGDFLRMVGAIQKQVARDLRRFWRVDATVDAYHRLGDVPSDYWQIIIRDDIGYPGIQGVHWTKDRQPFALVLGSTNIDRISTRVSHEALEMLVDPFGDSRIAGMSLDVQPKRVDFLVEICDPTQGEDHTYRVNDVMVADFVTPFYYDPNTSAASPFSFCGKVVAPHGLLDGGYISWIDPVTSELIQVLNASGKGVRFNRGPYDPSLPIRWQSDRLMEAAIASRVRARHTVPTREGDVSPMQRASSARAMMVTSQVEDLISAHMVKQPSTADTKISSRSARRKAGQYSKGK